MADGHGGGSSNRPSKRQREDDIPASSPQPMPIIPVSIQQRDRAQPTSGCVIIRHSWSGFRRVISNSAFVPRGSVQGRGAYQHPQLSGRSSAGSNDGNTSRGRLPTASSPEEVSPQMATRSYPLLHDDIRSPSVVEMVRAYERHLAPTGEINRYEPLFARGQLPAYSLPTASAHSNTYRLPPLDHTDLYGGAASQPHHITKGSSSSTKVTYDFLGNMPCRTPETRRHDGDDDRDGDDLGEGLRL